MDKAIICSLTKTLKEVNQFVNLSYRIKQAQKKGNNTNSLENQLESVINNWKDENVYP